MKLTWENVLAWRMRQQFLDRPKSKSTETIVRQLCGVQSQVKSNAELAVAARTPAPGKEQVQRAVVSKKLMRTWAMRGTLHTLSTKDAPAFLALLAAARTWEKGAWQRAFLNTAQMAKLEDVVRTALDGAELTREELVAQLERKTGDKEIATAVRSGWGAVLKPLAWQGYLCNGDGDGQVTFTSPATFLPGWKCLPDVDAAAAVAIPAYLAAHGPASQDRFNRWLIGGGLSKPTVRSWFADLGDTLTEVDVEGERLWARTEDVDALASAKPAPMVRLLPGFDQYVLGAGTDDTNIIPASHRKDVSKTSGWIAPVVISAGRVVGVWDSDGKSVSVIMFRGAPRVPEKDIDAEVAHLTPLLGTRTALRVSVS